MSSVFIFRIEDIEADGWASEVAVVADSRQEAYRCFARGRSGRPGSYREGMQ